MRLKRYLKCTAILSTLCVGMMFPMAAQAESEYETEEVTTYLFDMEHQKEMTLAFKTDLPSVPYVSAEDYLEVIYADDFTEEKQGDGIFRISTSKASMVIDVDQDTVFIDKFYDFYMNSINSSADMTSSVLDAEAPEIVGTPKSVTFDLDAYDIDLMEVDGKAYFPLPTIADFFMNTYNSAQYLDGKLYFAHTSDVVLGALYYDRSPVFERLERDRAEAEYSYNELCFSMDHFYGAPSRNTLAPTILELGFDATLDTTDTLRKAKTYLKSESLVEYALGLFMIGTDLFDGGHTNSALDVANSTAFYPDSAFVQALLYTIQADPNYVEDVQAVKDFSNITGERNVTVALANQAKVNRILSEYTQVKEWKNCGATLYTAGDTAMFIFDSFTYPVVDAFVWAVDYAEENGFKNFVVDLSTNGGGITQVGWYMVTLMSNKTRRTNGFMSYSGFRTSGDQVSQLFVFDLNLDGKIDDADKDVVYDLNFAFLESSASFSTGNITPVLAKEMGIPVLGETSGGGECALVPQFLPSGYFITISGLQIMETEGGADVDMGATPDINLLKIDPETGLRDYSDFYDPKILSAKIHEFYGDYENEWINGVWYDAEGKADLSLTGSWKRGKNNQWWYSTGEETYLYSTWAKIDGKIYSFDADGYMEANAYRNGYYLTSGGAWDGKKKVKGWQEEKTGWRYATRGDAGLSNCWAKIDGKWYYFKADGYMAAREYIKGYWLNPNGIWSYKAKAQWKKNSKGWYYIDSTGWYAKDKTYKIDGKKYSFDAEGYCINP